MSVNYTSGDIFSVINNDLEISLCVVVALDGSGIVLGHFFKPGQKENLLTGGAPEPELIKMFGDLYIIHSRWKKVGYAAYATKMHPPFLFRHTSLFEGDQIQEYDADLNLISRRGASGTELDCLPESGLAGAEWIVKKIKNLRST